MFPGDSNPWSQLGVKKVTEHEWSKIPFTIYTASFQTMVKTLHFRIYTFQKEYIHSKIIQKIVSFTCIQNLLYKFLCAHVNCWFACKIPLITCERLNTKTNKCIAMHAQLS